VRALAVVATVALAAAAAVASGRAATGTTSLTVLYWSDGPAGGPAERWTLRCGPAGGTHPQAARACQRLAALGAAAFRPVRDDAVCTQVFGGPQTALVVGTYKGRRIWTRFNRKDGCQIARWNQHVPLLPSGDA
jgi:hypothetical protein